MNYGIQISASAALTAVYRQEVLSNNLANLNTVGFKPDIAATMQRDPARVEDGLPNLPSNDLIERLGGGVLSAPNRIGFAQGPITSTGNPLDVAIEGDGFLVVRETSDGSGAQLRLTRDGRLSRDSDGRLVLASSGLPVLDTNDRAITLPTDGSVRIDTDGTIRLDGSPVAQLQLTDVPDRSQLVKHGESLFAAPTGQIGSRSGASGRLIQEHVEGSGVNPISALMQMTGAARTAQGALGMISTQNQLLERTISVFSRSA